LTGAKNSPVSGQTIREAALAGRRNRHDWNRAAIIRFFGGSLSAFFLFNLAVSFFVTPRRWIAPPLPVSQDGPANPFREYRQFAEGVSIASPPNYVREIGRSGGNPADYALAAPDLLARWNPSRVFVVLSARGFDLSFTRSPSAAIEPQPNGGFRVIRIPHPDSFVRRFYWRARTSSR
jgi:hypothetical protein